MDRKSFAEALATAALAGPLIDEELRARWAGLLGRSRRWMSSLARRIVAEFGEHSRPRRFRIVRFLLGDDGFAKAFDREGTFIFAPAARPRMSPSGKAARWLELPFEQLAWFADLKTLERLVPDGSLRHYRYRWLTKRDGSARLLEIPKPRLKAMQRRILAEILDRIPPHPAVHGFRATRSAIFLREKIAPQLWLGVVLISAGVALVFIS